MERSFKIYDMCLYFTTFVGHTDTDQTRTHWPGQQPGQQPLQHSQQTPPQQKPEKTCT